MKKIIICMNYGFFKYLINKLFGIRYTTHIFSLLYFRYENDSYTLKYEMRTQLTIRVNRRNDYYVHKIVSSVIGIVVIIAVLLLVGKKVLGHKLGWETKPSNYAPTWPNAVPTACRRSASAGSLHSLHHSRSTLR